MEISAFATLVIPFIVLIYIIVVTFMHLPKAVIIASLTGGLIMGIINALFDLLAYYAHWWHYTLNGLLLHLPLPFYITPFLIYGGIGYLVIWRLWRGRYHWIALLLLFGIPLFRAASDILGAFQHTSYATFDSSLAAPMTVVMWLLMFFVGYGVFRLLAPTHKSVVPV
ncbi:MAG: hypothetical protein M3Z24_12510 [Chloroflexota bacterium]|nr:hypothetical protein [Chloroflexota bacterium]